MSQIMQTFWLATVLPDIVFPLLIALVAILGIARWPRTLLVLALVALVLRFLGILMTHFLLGGHGTCPPPPGQRVLARDW